MKIKQIGAFLTILLTIISNLNGQTPVSLDRAIQNCAEEIESVLMQNAIVAVLSFSSRAKPFSDYVLYEMMTSLQKSKKITLVERERLDLVLQEQNFQASGHVSDSSAQFIGQLIGATSIVTGSIEDVGRYYRIRFRAIDVESGAIQALSAEDVRKDNRIAFLMNDRSKERGNWAEPLTYGALNIVLGLGSHLQGDRNSSRIIMGGYALATGLIVWELAGLSYDDAIAGIPGTIGLGLAGATMIFGFVKPFFFNKNPAFATIIDRVNVTPVYSGRQINAFQITYSYNF